MLRRRVISALVMLPVVLSLFALGGWPYVLLIVVVTLLATSEYVQMFRRLGYQVAALPMMLLVLAWEIQAIEALEHAAVHIAGAAVMTLSFWTLIQSCGEPAQTRGSETWALSLAGGTYLGLGGGRLIALRARPSGFWWLLATCAVVWIGDTAAYFVGRRLGRHKIAPAISPGKSWEGFVAQIVGGLLGGTLFAWLSVMVLDPGMGLTLWQGVLLGLVISLLCPAGDFLVSLMKRQVGVKDTGTIIPGHGGVFDRLDSILWAALLGDALAWFLT